MFRKGGSTSDGIIDLAMPRAQYAEGKTFEEIIANDAFGKQAYELLRAAQERDVQQEKKDILSNLLIKGGLGLVAGDGAGKGLLAEIATPFRKPAEEALTQLSSLKKDPAKMAAAQAMIAQKSAERIKEIEALGKTQKQLMDQYDMGEGAVSSYLAFQNKASEIARSEGLPLGRNASGDPIIRGTYKNGKFDYRAAVKTLPQGIYFDPYSNNVVKLQGGEAIVLGSEENKQGTKQFNVQDIQSTAPELSEEEFGQLAP